MADLGVPVLCAARQFVEEALRFADGVAVDVDADDHVGPDGRPTRQRPTTVAGYVPVGSEPGGPDLPEVLHDGELVDTVPSFPHDRPVLAVITPAHGMSMLTGH